jgi:hypothetical protein
MVLHVLNNPIGCNIGAYKFENSSPQAKGEQNKSQNIVISVCDD